MGLNYIRQLIPYIKPNTILFGRITKYLKRFQSSKQESYLRENFQEIRIDYSNLKCIEIENKQDEVYFLEEIVMELKSIWSKGY